MSATFTIEKTATCTACGAILPVDTDTEGSGVECPRTACKRVNHPKEESL